MDWIQARSSIVKTEVIHWEKCLPLPSYFWGISFCLGRDRNDFISMRIELNEFWKYIFNNDIIQDVSSDFTNISTFFQIFFVIRPDEKIYDNLLP